MIIFIVFKYVWLHASYLGFFASSCTQTHYFMYFFLSKSLCAFSLTLTFLLDSIDKKSDVFVHKCPIKILCRDCVTKCSRSVCFSFGHLMECSVMATCKLPLSSTFLSFVVTRSPSPFHQAVPYVAVWQRPLRGVTLMEAARWWKTFLSRVDVWHWHSRKANWLPTCWAPSSLPLTSSIKILSKIPALLTGPEDKL